MSKVNIEIDANPEQIRALKVYLGRKDTYLEFEIEQHIESLYKKNVPAIVRDYIAADNENQKKDGRSEAI